MAVSSSSTAASDLNKSRNDTKQRTKNLGVRIINGKIYDSEKGKTCHQCHQKTRSFTAACKNQKKNKPCTLLFCHKCLLNRYGEKAEEVEVLEEWSCPRCRGICNCSCCRINQGQLPTGILCHRAKATGHSSVSELLHASGPENFGLVKDSYRNKKRNADKDIEGPGSGKTKQVKHDIGVPSVKNNTSELQFQSRDVGVNIPLPHGTELISIGDVELPPEDVGNALQFLEFCAAFGKTLNMKKGQSSVILQELMDGKSRTLRRSEQYSPVVHFHIQLLSLLQKEFDLRPQKLTPSNGKNSWLIALKNCLSESPNAIDSLPIDSLDREAGGYNTIDSSTKLRILIFLCDEVLETARIRDWINDQELKFAKKAKQAKEKVLASKDKEKSLKQKMTNELAKAIIAKDGASLSISEHDEIVREIKCEAAQAHKEMLESMNTVPKAKERAKAIRTQPIFLDVDGRAFWRLSGYSEESNILVQDIGQGDDSAGFGEKWISFDDEQEKVVEKHISFRERMARAQPVAEMIPSQTFICIKLKSILL